MYKLIKNIAKKILYFINKIYRSRIVIKEINGVKYKLDLREYIDYSIYTDSFEKETTNIMKVLVKPDMTVLDIGANIGYYTFILADLSTQVIAFEPTNFAFDKLRENLSLNNFNNIIIEKKGLSDKKETKEVELCSSWPVFDREGTHPIHKGKLVKSVIDLITLDEYLKGKKIDFIKLDVDGYELKVLKGAVDTLEKYKPPIITEIGYYTLNEAGDSPEEMIDLLYSLGYVLSDETLKPYKNKTELLNSIPKKKTINIVAM